MHPVEASNWAGELARYRFADGAFMVDGVDLCNSCKAEFIGMLMSAERRYPDPPPP
jgi:hypothetical protein